MAEIRLYDSAICRLCAQDNGNGEMLFAPDAEDTELSTLVNRYLPLKVRDDGKLPRTICPGCNIQLEATVQFFELLVDGQRKIREMWKQQVERQRKADRERLRAERENTELTLDTPELENLDDENEDSESTEQIFINVLPDGSMYTTEHDLCLQMEGLDRPRRKRGRPPKIFIDGEAKEIKDEQGDTNSQEEEDKQDEEDEIDGDGRRRRKRKVPKRFQEAVQGKELDRIFKEEGVFDEEEEYEVEEKYEPVEPLHEAEPLDTSLGESEVIGHLETVEGKDLGELVVINRGRARGRPKVTKRPKAKRKNKFSCSHCGRGFLQRSKLIVHESFHNGNQYGCLACDQQFPDKDSLDLHQQTEGHEGDKIIEEPEDAEKSIETAVSSPLKIDVNTLAEAESEEDRSEPVIDPTISEEEEIEDVGTEESDKGIFKCDKCLKHFQSKTGLDAHIKVVHEGEKPFVCQICSKAFAYQTSLKGHIELAHQSNKTDKGFPCDICGKVLNHPSSIVYHKETEHNNGRRFVCNKCGKSFKHKQLLQRHQLVHSEDRPYPCKSCKACFKTKANLINHQSTHTGEKKHFCEICGQQFAHKTSLTLHYRWHTGQKPYKCEVCSKSFSQNGNLQEHMRIHTGEKPYCCDHCGRKFTTSSQFKLHVKRHTGERPWKCEFCAKSFLHKDTWKCHVRRHKGERPFQCAYCNRGFTEQWALKKHLRLHTGEKPYSCEICGKAFADCSNLTKHKKVHKNHKVVEVEEVVEGSTLGEVWQILPAAQEGSENTLGIATDETIGEEIPQIIYVSYQDPDDPTQSATLHFDRGVIPEQPQEETDERINMDLAESDLQLQITDEDGNPIPLSIQEARQLLSEGQFVSQLNDGQTIRVQGLASSEDQEQSNMVEGDEKENELLKSDSSLTIQNDADAIVKVLEDEDTDAMAVAAVNQMGVEDRLELADGQQTIEFTTQDGQKVRLVTSLNVDPLQLASEYLTIV